VWLESQVQIRPRNRRATYRQLLEKLYCTEFVWFVPNDDNRAEDGLDLRVEFINETGFKPTKEFHALGCSMLELIIGLARRLSFEAEGETDRWFWHLIENIGLLNCSDDSGFFDQSVENVLERVIFRTYMPDGRGGFFPLKEADEDQRQVELWYQLTAYVLERL
jgi:hypothetical protein